MRLCCFMVEVSQVPESVQYTDGVQPLWWSGCMLKSAEGLVIQNTHRDLLSPCEAEVLGQTPAWPCCCFASTEECCY